VADANNNPIASNRINSNSDTLSTEPTMENDVENGNSTVAQSQFIDEIKNPTSV
jgi:hypothetical protein